MDYLIKHKMHKEAKTQLKSEILKTEEILWLTPFRQAQGPEQAEGRRLRAPKSFSIH